MIPKAEMAERLRLLAYYSNRLPRPARISDRSRRAQPLRFSQEIPNPFIQPKTEVDNWQFRKDCETFWSLKKNREIVVLTRCFAIFLELLWMSHNVVQNWNASKFQKYILLENVSVDFLCNFWLNEWKCGWLILRFCVIWRKWVFEIGSKISSGGCCWKMTSSRTFLNLLKSTKKDQTFEW